MPFDPAKPATGSATNCAEMRAQLNALHDAIAAVPVVTGAVVDSACPGRRGK